MHRRRDFLRGLVGGAGVLLLAPLRVRADSHESSFAATHRELLESSDFVYVSPIKSDGAESRCHAEVWYAWLDGAVVMTVSSAGWKARAVGRGLERARVWVGNHGRLKGLGSGSQAFRKAPRFDARSEAFQDPALLDRLLAEYDRKYPKEIASWRDKMRQGHADGSRTLVRYTPVAPRT